MSKAFRATKMLKPASGGCVVGTVSIGDVWRQKLEKSNRAGQMLRGAGPVSPYETQRISASVEKYDSD
jgi:hypothetical protein